MSILQPKSIIIRTPPYFLSVIRPRRINVHNSRQLPIWQSKSVFRSLFLQKTWNSVYERASSLTRSWLQQLGSWFGHCWWILDVFKDYIVWSYQTSFLQLFELKFRALGNRIVRFIHFLVNECFLTIFQPENLLETVLLHMCF